MQNHLVANIDKPKTPYYSFDLSKIASNYQEFTSCFSGASVFYAMKSNASKEILETLQREGSGFEIASIGELDILLSIDVAPENIIFSNPVKSREAIKAAYAAGVRDFACDSTQEIDKLAELAPEGRAYVRVAVSEYGSRFSMSEKFGVLPEGAPALAEYAIGSGLTLAGLSFHVGSQAENLAQWRTAIDEVREVIVALNEKGIKIDFLNIGGGYPESYSASEDVPHLQDIASEIIDCIGELPYPVKLYLEPGRRLVANSATLTATVIARLSRQAEQWLFLDVGAYNGPFEAMIFQGNIHFEVEASPARDSELANFVLTGPTCDSLDTLSYDALLPKDIQEGDTITLKNVGAYSLCFASTFNGFDIPDAYFS